MFSIQNESVDFLKIIQDATALLERAPSDPLFFSDPKQAELSLLRCWTIINNELQRRAANNISIDAESAAFVKLQEIMKPLYRQALKYKSVFRQFKGIEIGLVN